MTMTKKNRRVVQELVLAAWAKSAMSKADLSRACPGIEPCSLRRYLDGRKDVYMRERSVESVLAALASGPQGPKREVMRKERA